MSTQEDTQKQLDAALARIAQLEADKAKSAKAVAAPPATGIDPKSILADPAAALAKAGLNVQHTIDHLIAQAMGDKAPKELRERFQVGQQVTAATADLVAQVQTLSQRLAAREAQESQAARRTSFMALAQDKKKYPTLAAALERDSSMFDDEISGEDAATTADRLEARYARVIGTPAAKDSTAATANGQSAQAKATEDNKSTAGVGTAGGALVLPPIPAASKSEGVLTPDDDAQLRQQILQQYEASRKAAEAAAQVAG